MECEPCGFRRHSPGRSIPNGENPQHRSPRPERSLGRGDLPPRSRVCLSSSPPTRLSACRAAHVASLLSTMQTSATSVAWGPVGRPQIFRCDAVCLQRSCFVRISCGLISPHQPFTGLMLRAYRRRPFVPGAEREVPSSPVLSGRFIQTSGCLEGCLEPTWRGLGGGQEEASRGLKVVAVGCGGTAGREVQIAIWIGEEDEISRGA